MWHLYNLTGLKNRHMEHDPARQIDAYLLQVFGQLHALKVQQAVPKHGIFAILQDLTNRGKLRTSDRPIPVAGLWQAARP